MLNVTEQIILRNQQYLAKVLKILVQHVLNLDGNHSVLSPFDEIENSIDTLFKEDDQCK